MILYRLVQRVETIKALRETDTLRQMKHLLGIPDTNFSGRNTLTARNVRRSNSDPTEESILEERGKKNVEKIQQEKERERQRERGQKAVHV